MGTIAVYFALIIFVLGVKKAELSQNEKHTGFVRVVEECKRELNLTEHILTEMFHLWKLEYDVLNRNVGCIIICMSKKLEIIDVKGRLQHGKAHEFAMEHGADEQVATKVVAALHECEKQNEGIEDECIRVLEVAKCFRTGLNELNWSPKTEYLIGEVLTEV